MLISFFNYLNITPFTPIILYTSIPHAIIKPYYSNIFLKTTNFYNILQNIIVFLKNTIIILFYTTKY